MMKTGAVLGLAIVLLVNLAEGQTLSPVQLDTLQCEHLTDPIGIGARIPRLSWKLQSTRRGEVQTAYQIQAALSPAKLSGGTPDLWDSGKVNSDQSVLVPWSGSPLHSRSQVFWRVRVWDMEGKPSQWSDAAEFELGLLNATAEWKAEWITADLPRHDMEQAVMQNAFWISAGSSANEAAVVRRILNLPTNIVRSASVHALGDGFVTLYVNGHPIQHGRSSRTAPLQADIGPMLTPGSNIIAIHSEAVRNAVRRNRGEPGRNAIIAHGTIEFENSQLIEFNTDDSWWAATGPRNDWFTAEFDDSSWNAATELGRYEDQPSKYLDCTIGPGRYLRKTFEATGKPVEARLYSTALGVYEASINGERVSETRLDPGWTDYDKRVMVQAFDVTHLIVPGSNTLGAVLGDGWYAGRVGWMGLAQYGSRPVFAGQLEITYDDGSIQTIVSDDSWKGGSGAIVGSDLQWGEIIDHRQNSDWDHPAFDDSYWKSVIVEEHQLSLDPQLGPPIRAVMDLKPKNILKHGVSWIVDFGQNMVGHVRLEAQGSSGTTITLRHAEMLNADGSFYTENLRPALATDVFILNGTGRETFEPRFTFHGFRYVEVTGYPDELTSEDLRAIVVSSDTPVVGNWECSNPDLNQLYSNIVWGQRGNFLSVPTDCPQRDERMGWMGDALVFAPTAVRIADVSGFFEKWMVDVRDAQGPSGDFPNYAPRVAQPQPGWPVWGDAGVVVPWVMYQAYGDITFLADNYTNMTRWVDFNVGRSKNFILSGGVGDHLAPERTPVDLVDTAYFANSARIVARTARLLGYNEDEVNYTKLHSAIADAFNQNFVSANGQIRGDTQTAYILALKFDLLPTDLRNAAAQRLAEKIEQTGHLTTGFVGVGLICPALSQIDQPDLAWELVLNEAYPSWLFSVKNGATTIWERWDGWTPERGFQDSSMNSLNHYSLGSVGAWFFAGAAGIEQDEAFPGYKRFRLRPQFTSKVSWVKASLDTPHGTILSHWQAEDGKVGYTVIVPPNSTAELNLPVASNLVTESGRALATGDTTTTEVTLVPGEYHFTIPNTVLE